MFQIQSGCRNAKGQRGPRLLAGMTAATCWSGQQGMRLRGWSGRGRRREKEAHRRKKINFENNLSIVGRWGRGPVYLFLGLMGALTATGVQRTVTEMRWKHWV